MWCTARLLVATPEPTQGIFARSVVLVLHHDESGAPGVVINHPVHADIDAVLPGWQASASRPQAIFHGGPVGQDSALAVAHVPGDDPDPVGIMRLFDAVSLVDLDTPTELITPQIAGLRIFAGYAGWEPGQLEAEIATDGWWVVDRERSDVFDDQPHTLWSRVLRRQAGPLALVSTYLLDPTDN